MRSGTSGRSGGSCRWSRPRRRRRRERSRGPAGGARDALPVPRLRRLAPREVRSMKTPQFQTFAALAIYARQRAVKSARRNDPIAWAYWKDAAEWDAGAKPYPADDDVGVAMGGLLDHARSEEH